MKDARTSRVMRPWMLLPPALSRLAATWFSRRHCILPGLLRSLLTCVASVVANAALEVAQGNPADIGLLRRLSVGYAAAAAVVVMLFPLLPSARVTRKETPREHNRA